MKLTIPTPEPALNARPPSVTVLGWTFLVLSVLRLLVNLWSLLVWEFGDLSQFPLPRGPDGAVLRHFRAVVGVQAVLSAAVAFISASFLRLRPWARVAMEVVCWLALALVVTLTCIVLVASLQTSAVSGARRLVAAVAATVVIGLLGLSVWSVRRPRVRSAFENGTGRP